MPEASRLIDTHAHLYLPEFDADREAMLHRARLAGVEKILLPNIDSGSIAAMTRLEDDNTGFCHAMMGLHPCSVKDNVEEELEVVRDWLEKRLFVAIGEIGTDHYWDVTFADAQAMAFNVQMEMAKRHALPIVIHSRETLDLNIALIRNQADGRLKGIFHCFNGSLEQANQIINLGFLLGIGGVVTFKNAGVAEVVARLPLESLVLETDAPYLTPQPFRGKRNESAYTELVAQKIAEVQGRTYEEVCAVTTRTALELFDLSGPPAE